jgi:hypothetical protein
MRKADVFHTYASAAVLMGWVFCIFGQSRDMGIGLVALVPWIVGAVLLAALSCMVAGASTKMMARLTPAINLLYSSYAFVDIHIAHENLYVVLLATYASVLGMYFSITALRALDLETSEAVSQKRSLRSGLTDDGILH